jgi:hypothetical protein
MTTVTASPQGINGALSRGFLRFTPSTAWAQPGITDLPMPVTVKLVNGTATVELEPTGLYWAWAVTFQIYGLPQWTRYYAVPSTGSFNLTELAEVDPQTLVPSGEPAPVWYAYVDQIVAGQVGKVTVVTGNEARPPFGSVFWVGGTIQPTNMADGSDIWFKATS